ncbi:hypothetical protein EVAR_77127_1 [Eumeta japonica]|uniref:Uncharacterized protein n=1 Tax=Eumeta variegata TaxID=151549 RepID=A0A4C1T2L4_EUMVA|nr:hypothetical protein EVAR_77127_1 [Eumeta japonica]
MRVDRLKKVGEQNTVLNCPTKEHLSKSEEQLRGKDFTYCENTGKSPLVLVRDVLNDAPEMPFSGIRYWRCHRYFGETSRIRLCWSPEEISLGQNPETTIIQFTRCLSFSTYETVLKDSGR